MQVLLQQIKCGQITKHGLKVFQTRLVYFIALCAAMLKRLENTKCISLCQERISMSLPANQTVYHDTASNKMYITIGLTRLGDGPRREARYY